METARESFVHEARLQMGDGVDPAAPGAAVTIALCGSCDHEGPCRWPHNNDAEVSGAAVTFRTLFVAPAADETVVRAKIERALRDEADWSVIDMRHRPVSAEELPLAGRLAATPSK
jgi:hypothetical protein